MASTLFDDVFTVTTVDSGRYDRVARIQAESANNDVSIDLDINTELYPLSKNDSFTLALARSLHEDGEDSTHSWRDGAAGGQSLADDYDYVMYGTIYKFEEPDASQVAMYCSFGGLILRLQAEYRRLHGLKQEKIYLLMRR